MEEDIELEESIGKKFRLDSINCSKCKVAHKLMDGFGDGAIYWCHNEMMKINEGDDINMIFEDE